MDRRLYLPQEWGEDEAYPAWRRRGGGPTNIAFKTKPTLGGELMRAMRQAGPLRCRWGTGDEALGRDPDFWDRVAVLGLWSLAEVPHDTQGWRQRPATAVPAWSGQGRKPTRPRVLAGEAMPAEVARMAALRVIAVREGLPGPEVWVVLRRNVLTGELKTYLCNAPVATPLARLVRLSGMRWPIETWFEDDTQDLGMGDYEVRSWRGWHHHMPLCILAHFFLVRTCRQLKRTPQRCPSPRCRCCCAASCPGRRSMRSACWPWWRPGSSGITPRMSPIGSAGSRS